MKEDVDENEHKNNEDDNGKDYHKDKHKDNQKVDRKRNKFTIFFIHHLKLFWNLLVPVLLSAHIERLVGLQYAGFLDNTIFSTLPCESQQTPTSSPPPVFSSHILRLVKLPNCLLANPRPAPSCRHY